MSVIRKSIRLYSNNETDKRICEGLGKFKDYGFESENQMIRFALLRFLSDKLSDCSPDELADLICERIIPKLSIQAPIPPVPDTESHSSEDAAYNAALNFLDSL
ncbi:MAG: hypothetical protein K6E75_13215 [Lachnospiraceae bacterium]|nr:hypothetical protein [Lachnospiraceae bacterium]